MPVLAVGFVSRHRYFDTGYSSVYFFNTDEEKDDKSFGACFLIHKGLCTVHFLYVMYVVSCLFRVSLCVPQSSEHLFSVFSFMTPPAELYVRFLCALRICSRAMLLMSLGGGFDM